MIARDGRRVRDEDLDPGYGAANLCDVPALEWLERQPRPRVWVCDGNVTGRRRKSQYEVLDAKVGEECAVICRRSDILRVDNMEGLNKWLDEHRVRGRGRQKRLAY